MLVKKELAEIEVLGCPSIPHGKTSRNGDAEFKAAACLVTLPRCGEILVVDIFNLSNELELRFFCDGTSFLCCSEWPTKTWHSNKPANKIGGLWYHVSTSEHDAHRALTYKYLRGNDKSKDVCYPNYSDRDSCLELINTFAERKNRVKQSHAMDNKYGKLREHFAMFPAHPADLADYCDKHVFANTYIFISKLEKGKRSGTCGYCGKKFRVKKDAKSGEACTCPKCGMPAQYRGAWIAGKTEKARICIAHKVDDQLLIRWAKVIRSFNSGKTKPKYDFSDYYYNLYLNTKRGNIIYSYALQPQMGYGTDWFRKKNGRVNYDKTFVYADNLNEVIGDKYYNVNLQDGLKNAGKISLTNLLDNLKNILAAEYLFKLGLTVLASDYNLPSVLGRGAGFVGMLGVSKQYLPLYQKFNIEPFEHRIIKAYGSWVSDNHFSGFRSLKANAYDASDIIELLQSMSFERFVNYFTKQKALLKSKSFGHILILYKDYISMSKQLKADLSHKSVRFPSDIKQAHDVVMARINAIKHKAEDKAFSKAIKKLYPGMPDYKNDAYCIVYPQKRSDLITEGQSLKHCVGGDGYCKNHIAGTRMIFFVRRIEEPGKPFYTMEIDMKGLRICQMHGFSHKLATPDVKKFADGFLRKLKASRKSETEIEIRVPVAIAG